MPRPRNWLRRRHLNLGAGVGDPDTPADDLTYGGVTVREYCDAIERGGPLHLSGDGRGKVAFVKAILAEMAARGRRIDLGPDYLGIPVVPGPRIPKGRPILVSTAIDPAAWDAACDLERANPLSSITLGVDFGARKDATTIVPVVWPGGKVIGQAAVTHSDRGMTVETTVFDRVRRHLVDAKALTVPSVGFSTTPQQRRELQVEMDKAIYGNAYVTVDGKRIDPRTVQTLTSADDPPSVVGYQVHVDGEERIYDPADVTHESRCGCGDPDCLHLAFGYPHCAACREHHRPPDCDVDEHGRALNPDGQPWADETHTWDAAKLDRIRGILRERATERFKAKLAAFEREYVTGSEQSAHDDIAAAAVRHWREHVERRLVFGTSPLRLDDLIETEDDAQRRYRVVTIPTIPIPPRLRERDAALRDVIDTRLREMLSQRFLDQIREGGLVITGASDFTGTRSPGREKNPAKNSSNPAESGMPGSTLDDFLAWCERLEPGEPFRLEPFQRRLFYDYVRRGR